MPTVPASALTLLLGLGLGVVPVDVPLLSAPTETTTASLSDELSLALVAAETRSILADSGLPHAHLTHRVKSQESLAAKARRKGKPVHAVLDRLAMRVQVDEIDECYDVLEAVTSRYQPVAGAFDDYIAHPKANGYQSLHTALHTPLGIVELQVRTHAMHHHAEHGAAAHHLYKAAQASA